MGSRCSVLAVNTVHMGVTIPWLHRWACLSWPGSRSHCDIILTPPDAIV